MPLSDLTVSLDTARALKAAGFPQANPALEWRVTLSHDPFVQPWTNRYGFCAAPTLEEILREIPPDRTIDGDDCIPWVAMDDGGAFSIGYSVDDTQTNPEGTSMAEAAAALYLALHAASLAPSNG